MTIAIFNILGQQVKILIDEVKPAGRYSVSWNGTDEKGTVMTAGTYIFQIQVGTFSDKRKLMFMK